MSIVPARVHLMNADWVPGDRQPWDQASHSVLCLSVCLCVRQSVTDVSAAKTAEPIEMLFGFWTLVGPRNHMLDPPIGNGQFWGKEEPIVSIETFCRELCKKSGWADWFVIWIVDLGGPKVAQVQSYSPGGANVPSIPLNRPCAAAMRRVVKLLWPLVVLHVSCHSSLT